MVMLKRPRVDSKADEVSTRKKTLKTKQEMTKQVPEIIPESSSEDEQSFEEDGNEESRNEESSEGSGNEEESGEEENEEESGNEDSAESEIEEKGERDSKVDEEESELESGDDEEIDLEENSDEANSADDNDEEEFDRESDGSSDSEGNKNVTVGKLGNQYREIGNAGWADAISKVLASTKPKTKKSVILSRAKRDVDIIRTQKEKEQEEAGFEVEGEEKRPVAKKQKVEDKASDHERKQQRKEWDLIGRKKPEVLTSGMERQLSRIATKGVVQLFNAVRIQQKTLSTQLREAGPLERKREMVLKSLNKETFMDLLHKTGTKEAKSGEPKKEVKDEPLWGVLRDDFMEGGKQLKDWDKMDSDDESS